MGALLALAAALTAVVFAIWPLVRRRPSDQLVAGELDELRSRRDVALSDLRELDFDRDLGNLTAEDHLELLEQSKRRAVTILKQLRRHDSRLDDEIEQAVAALRRPGGRAAGRRPWPQRQRRAYARRQRRRQPLRTLVLLARQLVQGHIRSAAGRGVGTRGGRRQAARQPSGTLHLWAAPGQSRRRCLVPTST